MDKQSVVCVLNFFVEQKSWFSFCVPAAGSNAAGQAPGLVTTLPLMLCKQTNKQQPFVFEGCVPLQSRAERKSSFLNVQGQSRGSGLEGGWGAWPGALFLLFVWG